MISRAVLAGLAALALSVATVFAPISGSSAQSTSAPPDAKTSVATFAGGCFWCMEPPFDRTAGVISTISGYMGGKTANPTYEQVASGTTGHAEVVQVTYDPAKISYEKLLDVFWRNIDPTDSRGQFCDRGSPYRPGVFYHDPQQKEAAEASKTKLDGSGQLKKPIVAEIVPAGPFTPAEEYHQDFYKKNPNHYYRYRTGCGRDRRLEELWGKATQ